jgi:endoglucanase
VKTAGCITSKVWGRLCWPIRKGHSASENGFLSTSGNRIIGEHGRAIVLRGMSLFWSQWRPQFFNPSALRWLRDDWKINVVRAPLAVAHNGYLDNPDAERKKIESVIEAAIALDIYVIVDWHAHDPYPEQASRFFTDIARKYGHFPNLIYEIWNEPADHYDWAAIKGYHCRVISALRSVDPRNLVIVGTQNWCRDVDIAAEDPLCIRNIAYALHFYASSHGQPLRDKAERAFRLGLPMLITEWGTCHESGDGKMNKKEVLQWLRYLKWRQIGHLNWAISDKEETSAALRPGSRPEGPWTLADLSPSGKFVRARLRMAG